MTDSVVRSYVSPFSLRRPIREGRLFALLDATGFDDLPGTCRALGLVPESLYGGESQIEFQQEAPYMLRLDQRTMQNWKRLIRRALARDAGLAAVTDQPQHRARLHWKKWLSVILPDGRTAVFRFYDARILVAFLGTLSAADAQEFFGPYDALYVLPATGADLLRHEYAGGAPEGRPAKLGKGRLYRVSDAQVEAMAVVVDDEYRDRMRRYLRTIWAPETRGKSDAQLDTLIDDAASVGAEIGDMRLGAMTGLVVMQLVAPELLSPDRLQKVIADPGVSRKQRAGMLMAPLAVRYDIPDRLEFMGKIQAFTQYDF